MKIEFYIPKDEKIPTDLRLKVDGIDVYYERIKGGFRFYVYVDSDEKAMEIVKAITEQMILTMTNLSTESRGVLYQRKS